MLNDVLMTPCHHIQIHVYFMSSLYTMFHMTSRSPFWCLKTMKWRPCWCPKKILWLMSIFKIDLRIIYSTISG